MVIEWREREHEDTDNEALEDHEVIEALHNCGLNTFFEANNMCTKKRLMQLLIRHWDLEDNAFMMGGHTLKIEAEDIKFLTVFHAEDRYRASKLAELGA